MDDAAETKPDFLRKSPVRHRTIQLANRLPHSQSKKPWKRAETKLSQQLDDKLARSNLDEYSRWLNHLHTAQPEICLQPTSEGLTAHVWFETPMDTAEASPTSALSLRDVAGILSPLQ